MQIFLDTANLEQIREGVEWGIVDGVTTNPTLISKEEGSFQEIIKEICNVVSGPVSVECVCTQSQDIIKEARSHAKLAPNVVVKIPICREGLKATSVLSKENIKVNTTLVFSVNQALLAAKAGTRFVSPFIGRLDDRGHEGLDIADQIVTVLENYEMETEVIVASIRHPLHVTEAALIGADIATVPFSVLEKMLRHPLTDIGIDKFLKDWDKVKGR
ncbi:fructose-6-phosphate aldolase [bacterium]|nr:fructose-6-phosphate aldolase [bacterium]